MIDRLGANDATRTTLPSGFEATKGEVARCLGLFVVIAGLRRGPGTALLLVLRQSLSSGLDLIFLGQMPQACGVLVAFVECWCHRLG